MGPVPLVGEEGPDVFEALEVLESSGLDGGLGLTDQGDGGSRVLRALAGGDGE